MVLDLSINRTSDAYLDFVVSLKGLCNRNLQGDIFPQYESKAQAQPQKPASLEEVAQLVEPLPVYKMNRLLNRKAQEMMWSGIADAYKGREQAMLVELNRPEENALGSLELDPSLPMPDYYQSHEFHIQPGSYYGDPLSGVVYNMGQQVYNLRNGQKPKTQLKVAQSFPPPPTADPTQVRILVMGCGFGTTTWPFCEVYPQAQVWGIDLSAPCLQVGFKKAQTLGYKVHFSQQNAECTRFEAASFDMILAHSMFHELPKTAVRNTIREAHRLLKPGGHFTISDITPYRELSPWAQFVTDWQVAHNGEPFWRSTLREVYLPDIFKEAGYTEVRETTLDPTNLAVKFPWLTVGRK